MEKEDQSKIQIPESFTLDIKNIPIYDQGALGSSAACAVCSCIMINKSTTIYYTNKYKQ